MNFETVENIIVDRLRDSRISFLVNGNMRIFSSKDIIMFERTQEHFCICWRSGDCIIDVLWMEFVRAATTNFNEERNITKQVLLKHLNLDIKKDVFIHYL